MTQTVRWLDGREQAIWRRYLDMQARLMAQLGREMQDDSGLSHPDFAVLVQLSERPERRMRVLELARALRWEKSRLSHQLTRMQQRGLVERTDCNEDRRGAWIRLTDTGLDTVRAAAPGHVEGVRRYLFDALSPTEIEAFATVIDAVLERLDAVGTDPAGDCPDAAAP